MSQEYELRVIEALLHVLNTVKRSEWPEYFEEIYLQLITVRGNLIESMPNPFYKE